MDIPPATRAAVLTEHGAGLELTAIPLPTELAAGAALVRINSATLCGTDIEIWSGKMSWPGMLPMVLGHEMVGEVVAVGEDTRDALGNPIDVGDRIGWSESTCGECYGCTVLREPVACANRGYGFLQRSDVPPYATQGLADYAYVVPGAAKLLLPEDIPDRWAAMAGCAAKTVLRAFSRVGGVHPGSDVVVQGSGALGIFATALARISGAGRVVTVGAPAERLSLATEFGADETVDINHGSDATVDRVRELTAGGGADLVLDFAGAPSVGREAVTMAAQRGRVVIVGSTGPDVEALPLGAVMGKELSVVGSLNGDIADYHDAIRFFTNFPDRMPWDKLFGHPVGLSEASAGIVAMSKHQEIKTVVDPRIDAPQERS